MGTISAVTAARLMTGVREAFESEGEYSLRSPRDGQQLEGPELSLLERISPGERVLELGCAAGRVGRYLAACGVRVLGLDVARRLLASGRTVSHSQSLPMWFVQSDTLRLPVSRGVFSKAVLFKVLCYVAGRSNRVAWLAQVNQCLDHSGEVLLSQNVIDDVLGAYDAISEDIRTRFPDLVGELELGDGFGMEPEEQGGPRYIHYYLEADLLDELQDAGYHVLDAQRVEHVFYGVLRPT